MPREATVITVSDNIANSIAKKLDSIASSSERAQKNLELMKKMLKSFNNDPFKKYFNSIHTFTESIKLAVSETTTFKNAFNEINNTLERALTINIAYANQLKEAINNYQNFTVQLETTSVVAQNFGFILKTLFSFISIEAIAVAISLLTDFKTCLDDTIDSAKETYSSFEITAESFLTNAIALKELGYNITQQLTYTEALNNALATLAITGAFAASEINAFQSALMLAMLSGQELNSIINNSNQETGDLAEQLNVTTDKLVDAGEKGKITTDVIFQSLSNCFDMFTQKADDIPNRLLGAFTNLTAGIQEYIFETDNAIGANNKIAQAIQWFSDNVKNTSAALAVLDAGYIAATVYHALFVKSVEMGGKSVSKATATIMRLNLALIANPIGAIILAITAVIAALTLFSDEIKLTEDGTISLKDVAITVWGNIKEAASTAIEWIGGMWDGFVNSVNNAFKGMQVTVNDVFKAIIDASKMYFNTIVRLIMSVATIGSFAFNNLGDAWEIVWKGIANFTGDIIAGILNLWQPLFREFASVLSYFDKDAGKALLEKIDSMTIKFNKFELGSSAERGLNKLKDDLEKVSKTDYVIRIGGFLKEGYNSILEQTEKRKSAEETAMNPLPPENDTSKIVKGVTPLTQEHDKLLNSLKPIQGALQEYSKSLSELTAMYKEGSITASQYNEYTTLLTNKYEESIDPLGHYNKELDKQWNLMKLSSEQRAIENELYRVSQDMVSRGLVLSQVQNDELRKKIALNENYVRILSIKDSLESNSQLRKDQNFADLVSALIELKDSENYGYNDLINALNSESASPFAGMFEGSWVLMSEQISQFQKMYEQINELTEKFNLDQSMAASLRAQVWAKQNEFILNQANKFFEQLAQMQNSNNVAMARIGKAAAIAQAVINTYQAANAAYAAMAGIPYVGPALGAAAAAMAIATGMANVSAMRSQSTGFMTGGYTGNIARNQIAGVVHGQEFVMNAAATQRIGVDNLEALQRGDINGLQRPQVVNNYSQSTTQENTPQTVSPTINIALVSDYESAEQWLATQEGVKRVMQINRDNGEELAMIVNAS
ncbi:hypothetical protein A9G24_01225 [Gilliamella sp. App6-5]|uniref:tape measure protein n=1 Tax=Gilliamella sp. App6-5 TaxID=3120232 RepID=UPI00080EA2D0|nr:tape measure protein [Gilliamella apicola]OCG15995.1 hypothetical protein A9G24_01225 [Gilliamella apicola]